MSFVKLFYMILLSIAFISCGENAGDKIDFTLNTNATNNKISIDNTLELSITNPKSLKIDSIQYFIDNNSTSKNIKLTDLNLGERYISAKVYSEGKERLLKSTITLLNSNPPKVYTYKILNEYPHDISSYTQGLEFYNGELYESTGQYGESKLRKLDYKTGEVLKNNDLDRKYFGEGLTIFNNKIYQLTWQNEIGFIYDIDTFEKIDSFNYVKSEEGWGICNDGTTLYKSDGTEKIWTLNSTTLEEENYIQAFTNKGKVIGLNELEWIDGKIYANRYQKDGVAIINPKNGAIEGVIDFSPLKKKVKQHKNLDVLNGLAWNSKTKTLFVTGKRWNKLFEVEIIEK